MISIPIRLRKPSKAMNPNGLPVKSNPAVTPMTASGTLSQITKGFRSELKSAMVVTIMVRTKKGIPAARAA